jgi:1-acyl-sn-glycerol-3-phosphate acyltransferase
VPVAGLRADSARTRPPREHARRHGGRRRRAGDRRGASVLSGIGGPDFDPRADVYEFPRAKPAAPERDEGSQIIPSQDSARSVDDWGRSEAFFSLIEPILDFYYRYWFRVEVEGVEHVPSTGGALLVSNHSGALPPDAPMIMQAIRNEHPDPRPIYMLGENWFKGYPGVGMITNKIGLVAAHPANAQRLLCDEGRLALVFPEGQKATRKVYWQRYHLRRFGRGGFVKTALQAGVPIVPIAVVGAEEAMPIFAHVKPLQRLTGLIYFPINHAFPWAGLAAGAMYLPAKFKIRFLQPVSLDGYGPEDAEDLTLVQSIAERVRGQIQREVDRLVAGRTSVWFG